MKHFYYLLLISCLSVTTVIAQNAKLPMMVAHRGCHIDNEIPENSLAGIAMAKRFGYPAIECDVKYTKDSIMVIMHDRTINRTMRNASDYSEIKEPITVSEHTFADLRKNYVLASNKEELRQPIPTLEELLYECKKYGIIPMLHSAVKESYTLAQKVLGNDWIAFDADYQMMLAARRVSDCLVLLDPGQATVEESMEKLRTIGGYCGISSMKYAMLNAEYAQTLRRNGYEVQSSIFPTPHEMQAIEDGLTIILSDFCFLPDNSVPAFDKWYVKNKSLDRREMIEKSWERVEYGGILLKVRFKGAIEIIVNGRHYPINHSAETTNYIGVRIAHNAPSFRIVANDKTVIDEAEVKVYKF